RFRTIVAAGLDIGSNPNSPQATGALRLCRTLVKNVSIGELLGASERPCEITGIVHLPCRSFVRQRLRLDKISATYGIGRDSEIVCCRNDHALEQICAFRPPAPL